MAPRPGQRPPDLQAPPSGVEQRDGLSVSGPDPKYHKDGSGLRPNWRFALRWPRTYLWFKACRYLPWSITKHLKRALGRGR